VKKIRSSRKIPDNLYINRPLNRTGRVSGEEEVEEDEGGEEEEEGMMRENGKPSQKYLEEKNDRQGDVKRMDRTGRQIAATKAQQEA